MRLRIALPKGSLERDTFAFLERAGLELEGAERSYRPRAQEVDIYVKLLRPQEIPRVVSEGLYDLGVTGLDWVVETGADVEVLQDLMYGKGKLVLAVDKSNVGVDSFDELLKKMLSRKDKLQISTEYLNITSNWITSRNVYKDMFGDMKPTVVTPWWVSGENKKVSVFLSFGATEAKPPEEADAIIDFTSTGTTLEQNNLKPIEVVMETSAQLIANKSSLQDPEKRESILDILSLFRGVVEGRRKLHIFINVREENLNRLIRELPALKSPTISPLSEKGWYAVNTVIDRDTFLRVLPVLRKYAQGLVVHEPKQVLSLEEVR